MKSVTPSGTDPVDSARELGPAIKADADEIERIPGPLPSQLHTELIRRILPPHLVDGYEMEPWVYLPAIQELSRHDCSRRPKHARAVADAGQTSMHAWGAAIDINTRLADYWLWRRGSGDPPPYVNRIPSDIVAVFERHGFIWGGRWAHYDTMHFEYRPELLGYRPPNN